MSVKKCSYKLQGLLDEYNQQIPDKLYLDMSNAILEIYEKDRDINNTTTYLPSKLNKFILALCFILTIYIVYMISC